MNGNKETNKKTIFVDLETTGLDFMRGRILELASIVIGEDGETEEGRFHRVVHWDKEALKGLMVKEVADAHLQSGLLADVKRSTASLADVDRDFAAWLVERGAQNSPMGGSSVHFDRNWIGMHLHQSRQHFHHRIIDVSVLKEIAKRRGWVLAEPEGSSAHRAMPDIEFSVALYKFYMREIIAPPREGLVLPARPTYQKSLATKAAMNEDYGKFAEPQTKVVEVAAEPSSPTKVKKLDGGTRVTHLHEDHQTPPQPKGGTRVKEVEPVVVEAIESVPQVAVEEEERGS